ncbi:prepilin-type N-terminal cleavage/methylation domain-containing protein [Betaproteobacteria bacterium]|nr:prepilin-type N-terminal cleavage/methylation domain-containing protein [Betaproteobacteria bacterium]
MKPFFQSAAKRRGFSLPELAIIILILGLLTPLVWKFVSAKMAQEQARVTYSLLEEADWALTGYAMSHDRLPCPAPDADGVESCTSETGYLPWKALGIADARAGQMRYGVLRRTSEVDDPEAVTGDDDWDLVLPRHADLTQLSQDRFYPFFAFLGTDAAAGITTLPELKTTDATPVTAGGAMLNSANVPLNHVNTLDFCWTLRVAEDPPPADASSNLNINGTQIAYALRLPGELPDSGGTGFTPPAAHNASRAVSLATLWQRLECGEASASIGHAHPNVATASVMFYRSLFDYEQVQRQAVALAEVNVQIATSQVISAAAGIIDAVSSIAHAVGDTALATNFASVAAAVLQTANAALQMPLAVISLNSAVAAQKFADQRLHFVMNLRDTAHPLAQQILNNATRADAQGLYSGNPY